MLVGVAFDPLIHYLGPMKFLSRSVALALVAFSALAPLSTYAAFQDIPSDHPNAEAIAYLQTWGIVQGYPDGTFRPKALINRAEFTKILVGAFYPGEANGSECFRDVTTQWFSAEVCFAKAKGIVVGYSDGTFRPETNVNLAEAAKIITRAAKLTVDTSTYSPAAPWYAPFIGTLTTKRAIPATFTVVSQSVSRAAMAEMIYRIKANVTTRDAALYDTLVPPDSFRSQGEYVTYASYLTQTTKYDRKVFFFHASWCPECRALDADIREHLASIPYDLQIIQVDYDSSTALRDQFGVIYQHTLVQLDKEGMMVKKWTGSPTLDDLLGQLK